MRQANIKRVPFDILQMTLRWLIVRMGMPVELLFLWFAKVLRWNCTTVSAWMSSMENELIGSHSMQHAGLGGVVDSNATPTLLAATTKTGRFG